MKIIFTKFIPAHRLAAVNLFGIVFASRGTPLSSRTINHEAIHSAQMKEMLYVFFYLWYVIEWFVRLLGPGNAYRNISLEREAYAKDDDQHYLNRRRHYNWLGYL